MYMYLCTVYKYIVCVYTKEAIIPPYWVITYNGWGAVFFYIYSCKYW